MIRLLLIFVCTLSLAFAVEKPPVPVNAWDFATFANGEVKPSHGNLTLAGTGIPEKLSGKAGVRFRGGHYLSGILDIGPLYSEMPVAIEINFAPISAPTAYLAGLVQAGDYLNNGVRILLRQDLCPVVEHFAGVGSDKATYFVAGTPLTLGKFCTVRYEHDGKMGRLLVDGKVQDTKHCPIAAAWHGPLQIGSASGQSYDLDGVVSGVRIFALPVAKTR